MIPVSWLDQIHDREAFLNSALPDWKEKTNDADLALNFCTYMDHKEFERIVKETQ